MPTSTGKPHHATIEDNVPPASATLTENNTMEQEVILEETSTRPPTISTENEDHINMLQDNTTAPMANIEEEHHTQCRKLGQQYKPSIPNESESERQRRRCRNLYKIKTHAKKIMLTTRCSSSVRA